MFGLGPTELVIILVIVLIVFGVGKLSSVGGALGKSIREFREASEGNPTTNLSNPTTTPERPTTSLPDEQKRTGL